MPKIPFVHISAPPAEEALDRSARSVAAFYGQALAGVYGYFLHRCGGSAAVAEDLTQETFLAAVIELKKGNRVRQPSAWIYGIARHKLLDYYRHEQRAGRQQSLTSTLEELDGAPFAATDESEARDRAIAALATVAPSQRATLVLCYVDGYSVPEAAHLLGKSVEAVESLLARGRQTFKHAYLKDEA
jgi:RNA polymerase sigma-70 factor (ECF subfamily)